MEKGGHQDTRKIAFFLISLVAVFLMWIASAAAGAEDEVKLFEKAYGYYLDYQPELAVSAFGLFLDKFAKSPARDAALFWQAKALALSGRTDEARRIYSVIEEEFPESIFRDFARKESERLSLRPARESGSDGMKVRAKEGSGEQGSERLTAERTKLITEVKELSARLRESEARADGLAAEKNGAAAEIVKAQKERDEAVSALRDAELKLSEVKDAALRLREREKFQREQDEYIRKLKEELRGLADGITERDGKLSQAEKAIALLREQRAAEDVAKTGTQDRQRERDNEEIRKLRKASEDTAHEVEALTATLRDREKALAEKDVLVEKLSAENAAYEGKLKEAEASAAELKKIRGEHEKLKSDFAGATAVAKDSGGGDSAQKSERQYGELKQAYDSLAKRGRELETEIAELKQRTARYEAPVVRIGEMTYSIIAIAEHSRLASAVLSKIGAFPSWRRGDAYEDFITERLLLRQAGDGDKSRVEDEAGKLAEKYSLDRGERKYLTEYLAIEELLRKKKEGGVADEDAIRQYYEANKTDYLEKKEERTVNYLVMKYHKGEKLGSVALVSELQREAVSGKSFEGIARSRPDKVSLKRVKFDDLPEWIREKIQVLRNGEISSIFTEDQFIMLQMQVNAPVYRKYEDVREEIRIKLARKTGSPMDLETWLAELRKEAFDLR